MTLLAAGLVHPENWMPSKNEPPPSMEPGSAKIPPGSLAIGDFRVFYPAGGWAAVRSQPHPTLEVEGWYAATTDEVSVSDSTLLLDGRPVQPLRGYLKRTTDIAEMYDRLDFSYCGWHVTLPLENLAPGPHSLALQLTLSNGAVGVIRQVELR